MVAERHGHRLVQRMKGGANGQREVVQLGVDPQPVWVGEHLERLRGVGRVLGHHPGPALLQQLEGQRRGAGAVNRQAVLVGVQERRVARPGQPVGPRMQQRNAKRRTALAVALDAVSQSQELTSVAGKRAAHHRQPRLEHCGQASQADGHAHFSRSGMTSRANTSSMVSGRLIHSACAPLTSTVPGRGRAFQLFAHASW